MFPKNIPESLKQLEGPWHEKLPVRSSVPLSRIVYGTEPLHVIEQLDPARERFASLQELARVRISAFNALCQSCPDLDNLPTLLGNGYFTSQYYDLIRAAYQCVIEDPDTYGVWRVRLTTSSQMARTQDELGQDTVFFCHTDPFLGQGSIINTLKGTVSDGGVEFTPETLEKILKETPANQRIAYDKYLTAKGGNVWGSDFLNHPIFSTAFGNRDLFEQYVYALQVLSHLNIYHTCIHSGWRPGEMKSGFGRAISLGMIGEAFYPPKHHHHRACRISTPNGQRVATWLIQKDRTALHYEVRCLDQICIDARLPIQFLLICMPLRMREMKKN